MVLSNISIEEFGSLSPSVKLNSKAVPVFLSILYRSGKRFNSECIKVNSWLDFTAKFNRGTSITVKIVSNTKKVAHNLNQHSFQVNLQLDSAMPAIWHYFENGGGPCYIISVEDFSESNWLTNLPKQITACEDINLICIASSTGFAERVYNKINELLSASNRFFCIANGAFRVDENSLKEPVIHNLRKDQTAIYHPVLKINYRHQRVDSEIALTGYDGVNYLSELKNINSDLYNEIVQDIDYRLANITTENVMPCTAVAAAFCKVDRERGVWKSPANMVVINAVPAFAISINDVARWADSHVNSFRKNNSKKTLIWGARTLDSGDDWRYISVRRLFNSVEADIQQILRK